MKAFMLSNFVVPMIVYGEDAVAKMRELMGPTNSNEAAPGTIRGDYGDKEVINKNVIHGADSPENAIIEIERFFKIKLEQPK